jgi:hypothetical protein
MIKDLSCLRQHTAPTALYDSKFRRNPSRHDPKALELKQVEYWLNDQDEGGTDEEDSPPILWFSGDSTAAIAQTTAELYARKDQLLATFFLSKDSSRNTVNRIFATIAYQVAVGVDAVRQIVLEKFKLNPTIFDQSLETQFRHLVLRPLSQARTTGVVLPRLIIIDGLDEVVDRKIQLQLVRAFSSLLQPREDPIVKVLITCRRPSFELEQEFRTMSNEWFRSDSEEDALRMQLFTRSGFFGKTITGLQRNVGGANHQKEQDHGGVGAVSKSLKKALVKKVRTDDVSENDVIIAYV